VPREHEKGCSWAWSWVGEEDFRHRNLLIVQSKSILCLNYLVVRIYCRELTLRSSLIAGNYDVDHGEDYCCKSEEQGY